MKYGELRKLGALKYSKWFHHFGTMRVVKKRSNGQLILVKDENHFYGEYRTITDSHARDVFVWLGRYLALKGRLPRHLTLEMVAVGSQRTTKAIREVVAMEVLKTPARRGRK